MEQSPQREILFTGQKMPRESYTKAADIIEGHPNYPNKKHKTPNILGMTIEEYVRFCRERAKDNYTNDTAQSAQDDFEKVLSILER